MKAQILKKYMNQLQTLRQEFLNQGSLSVKADKTDEVVQILDEDSQQLSEMNQVIASNRNRNLSTSLEKIDAALNRIKTNPDDFGFCQDCGEEISPKRLELMPFAELCAECQGAKDQANKPGRRRHLTDYK